MINSKKLMQKKNKLDLIKILLQQENQLYLLIEKIIINNQ